MSKSQAKIAKFNRLPFSYTAVFSSLFQLLVPFRQTQLLLLLPNHFPRQIKSDLVTGYHQARESCEAFHRL